LICNFSRFDAMDGIGRAPFGPQHLLWWVYNALLTCGWPVFTCYYLLHLRLKQKYQENYRQRLGMDLPSLPSVPRRIWLHALSVGECNSIYPLIKTLKQHHPEVNIVVSTATATGQHAARQRLFPWVTEFFFLPHDFLWAVDRLVGRVKPSLFILVETDVWPNLLWALRRRAVPAVLVNARLSPTSFRRLHRIRALFGQVLQGFQEIFVQSPRDHWRFEQLGFPGHRLRTSGNLKFDQPFRAISSTDLDQLRAECDIAPGRPVWIGGSTHPGEEELLLKVHRSLLDHQPDLLLVLAPRQIQRGASLIELCQRQGFPTARRSLHQSAVDKPVYLLDTMGELARFYALADCAFLGGSLVPVGGHNPLEALAQGKPTLWGRFMFNFGQMEQILLEARCARRVNGPQELREVLAQWLADPSLAARTARAAQDLFRTHSGCSQKIADRISQLF
jgi:3-deoxy-D-manno-octulosonic-acid transferase